MSKESTLISSKEARGAIVGPFPVSFLLWLAAESMEWLGDTTTTLAVALFPQLVE